MPSRRRIRTNTPTLDITIVEGDGGGGGGTGNLAVGPDYGENPGNDGKTLQGQSVLDMPAIGLDGGLDTQSAMFNDQIKIDYTNLPIQTQSALSHDVGIDYDLIFTQSVLTMPQLKLDYGSVLAGESVLTMPALAMASDSIKTLSAITGTVLGPPTVIDATSGTIGGLNTQTLTVAVPTHIEGDLLVVCITKGGAGGHSTSNQAGWTAGTTANTGGNFTRYFYRFASSSEPASYTFNCPADIATTNIAAVGAMVAIRNVDTSTPIDDDSIAGVADANTSLNIPAATSTVANVLRLGWGGLYDSTALEGDFSFTPASGFVELEDAGVAATLVRTDAALEWRVVASIGNTDTNQNQADMTFTPSPTVATTVDKIGLQILVTPDPDGLEL